MRTHGNAKERTARRLLAIAMLAKGMRGVDVAKALGMTPRTIYKWKKLYAEGGEDAILAKPGQGQKPKLTEQQRQDLIGRLLAGPQTEGFSTDVWTSPRIAEVTKRHYNVEYHVNYIPSLMKSLGFSCQKPERQARERDEKAISTWKRKDWPRIKKKRAG